MKLVVFISAESVTMRRYRIALAAGLLAAGTLFVPTQIAHAQGKGHSKTPPGHAKKKLVTADQAILVTRQVLVSNGYEVVRVELVQGTRVIYYRRGNMGRGKGKGPIEKIVIRPEPDRVVFVSQPPRGLMVDINVRLGL